MARNSCSAALLEEALSSGSVTCGRADVGKTTW
jgi:hypothetical protein